MRVLMPFTVRVESGREYAIYERNAERAAASAWIRSGGIPVVMVLRGDEPFVRRRSWLRRLVDRYLA